MRRKAAAWWVTAGGNLEGPFASESEARECEEWHRRENVCQLVLGWDAWDVKVWDRKPRRA